MRTIIRYTLPDKKPQPQEDSKCWKCGSYNNDYLIHECFQCGREYCQVCYKEHLLRGCANDQKLMTPV